MGKLFVRLLDRISINQIVWNKSMFITLSDLTREWYGMLIGRVELSPNPNNPLVNNVKIFVDDLLIPEQRVSGADIRIDQEANQALFTDQVLMTMNQNKQRVLGWLHSHCRMGCFLSGTDLSNINDELSMLPFTVSIVVSYSNNSEYQETPNNKSNDVKPSNSRIKALMKIERAHKANLITTHERHELQEIITKQRSWKKPFKQYLAKSGIKLSRVSKKTKTESSKVNLEYYFNTGAIRSKAHGKTEFHMGVWFSHRAPFSEDKLTSRDLASHDVVKSSGHQVIDWPEQRPRQLKSLKEIVPSSKITEWETIMKEKIKSRFRTEIEPAFVQPYSRITHFLGEPATGGSGVKAKISHIFASAIENIISVRTHLPRHSPSYTRSKPTPISVEEKPHIIRDSFCPLCGHDLDFDPSWACDLQCDILRQKLAWDLGIEPDQLPDSIDHLDPDLQAEAALCQMDVYFDGDCDHCVTREEVELVCCQCNYKFDICGSQADVDGRTCEYCGNQLLYLYHILDPLNNYIGVVAFCEACREKFVYDWTTGLIVPADRWQEDTIIHHNYHDISFDG